MNNRIFVFTAEGGAGPERLRIRPAFDARPRRDDRDGRPPARRARPAAVPDPLRPQVPGLEPVVDQHLRHQVADAGRLAAPREVAPALRRRRRRSRAPASRPSCRATGATLTAHVYRELLPTTDEPFIRTDKVDVSCLAADPDAPPVAVATMTNLSALTRPSPENTKNYHGDKWQLKDVSVSYQPITNVEWDIETGPQRPVRGRCGVERQPELRTRSSPTSTPPTGRAIRPAAATSRPARPAGRAWARRRAETSTWA